MYSLYYDISIKDMYGPFNSTIYQMHKRRHERLKNKKALEQTTMEHATMEQITRAKQVPRLGTYSTYVPYNLLFLSISAKVLSILIKRRK